MEWLWWREGAMVSSNSQPGNRWARKGDRGTFSAWTMAIVFATVAVISFALDQTVTLSPSAQEQSGVPAPSLLHPVQLIQSLIDATSE
jgi:hypothetical protein